MLETGRIETKTLDALRRWWGAEQLVGGCLSVCCATGATSLVAGRRLGARANYTTWLMDMDPSVRPTAEAYGLMGWLLEGFLVAPKAEVVSNFGVHFPYM